LEHQSVPSPVISVEGVSKAFPGVRALSDVRFEPMPGEVHALMGERMAA
jgi:ABC-type sugar transport system ATPase subunit